MANQISKIKISGDTIEYNIVSASATTAQKVGENVTIFDETNDDKTYKGLSFNNGTLTGHVDMNSKGNLTVESMSKHVNIEAAKAIQVKPTTNIIIDTTRRLSATTENEAHIEVKYDDYEEGSTEEEWGYLYTEARAHDIRCYDHGGIALQIAGQDSDDKENKIKFESDRTSAIESAATYCGEGGKGLEFGTFNNLHTSLFTGDYRFKGDAKVYGVTREISATTEKTDYVTQDDDFKDIIDSGNCASWNQIIAGTKYVGLKESNGNLQLNATGLMQWDDSGETTDVPASINIVGDGKIALKPGDTTNEGSAVTYGVSVESAQISIPVKITKGGKIEVGDFFESGKASTKEELIGFLSGIPTTLSFVCDENNYTGATTEISAIQEGESLMQVKLYDIIRLASKADDLLDLLNS